MSLAFLFASDADVRLDALDHARRTRRRPHGPCATRVLLGDEQTRLSARQPPSGSGARGGADATLALVDALYDTHPSVRREACRAMARTKEGSGARVLRRLALEEPVWWVERRRW